MEKLIELLGSYYKAAFVAHRDGTLLASASCDGLDMLGLARMALSDHKIEDSIFTQEVTLDMWLEDRDNVHNDLKRMHNELIRMRSQRGTGMPPRGTGGSGAEAFVSLAGYKKDPS